MKFIFRLLSMLALIIAVIAAISDMVQSLAASHVAITPLGATWYALDPISLTTAQAAVQRYLFPFIWDPMIQWVLLQPTFAVFLVLSLLFYLAGYRRPIRDDGFSTR